MHAYVHLACDAAGCGRRALYFGSSIDEAALVAGQAGWIGYSTKAFCPKHHWLFLGGQPTQSMFIETNDEGLGTYVAVVGGVTDPCASSET